MPHAPCYLRFPSVRGDTLVFVADDDVWIAPSSGGTARRLSADRAPASHPKLSPDGTSIAYASRRDGKPEVFVVPADGGDVRRVTYLNDDSTRPIGWSDEGRVLFVSAAAEPFASRTWAYAVSTDGSGAARLPYGPVTALARGSGGAVVLGVNQSQHRGAAWKRYRGGTAAALWVDPDGSGEFRRFLRHLDGQLEDPVFVGDRVAFVSDHEGHGNVYSALPDGSDLRRHSDHTDFYARAAASDGRVVVYQCAGDLYRIDELTADSAPARVEISLGAPRSGRIRHPLRPADVLGPHAADHEGRASAVEARGEIHWLTHRMGPARLLGGGSGNRARLPRVVGTGEAAKVLFVTDADGEDALEVAPALGELPQVRRRLGAGQLGRVLDLAGSPDGTHAAAATHDGRVLLIGLGDGGIRTLSTSDRGDSSGLSFSPDSRFVAWSEPGPEPLRQIKVADVERGEVTDVTPLRFRDESPVFSLDGKHLAFLSARTFDPLYDTHVFDMSFATGARPYLVPLASATPSPFDAELAGRARPGHDAKGHDAKGTDRDGGADGHSGGGGDASAVTHGGDQPPEVHLDRQGLSERVVPFPVAAGRYSHMRPARGGFVWLSEPLEGVLGEGRAHLGAKPGRASLVRFDMETGRELHLVDSLDGFEVSGDGRTVVVRDANMLRALPADHRPDTAGPNGEAPTDVVDIDLSRLRLELM